MARSRSRIRTARLNVRLGLVIVGLAFMLVVLSWRFLGTVVPTESVSDHEATSVVDGDRSLPISGDRLSTKSTSDASHPLDPVLELARSELEAFSQQVIDYTAVMHKRERIGGTLGEESQLFVKIINRRSLKDDERVPLHVYLRFETPRSLQGREVIWVEGKNDGDMIAHEAGLLNLMSVKLAPAGSLAMMGNKYPITGIGMGNLFTKLIEKGERDRRVGGCEVTIREHERLDDLDVVMIEVKHPEKQAEFDFHLARIYLDTKRHLPIRYESYLWPRQPGDEPLLEEQYTYSDIQLNVGLAETDFDPENKAYQFP